MSKAENGLPVDLADEKKIEEKSNTREIDNLEEVDGA